MRFLTFILLMVCVVFSVFAQHATAATAHVPNPGVETIEGLEIGLATAIRKQLNITDPNQPITLENMEALTSLVVHYNSGISSLKGLEHATNLTELRIYRNRVSDVSSLRGLTNLRDLSLDWNAISDISPLSGLTNLRSLGLSDNAISNVSAVKKLTNLIHLDLNDNAISDISPLSGLTNLRRLRLQNNKLTDVSALSSLTKLHTLNLSSNKIRDISPLAGLTGLTTLSLDYNPIANIDPIKPIIEDGKMNRLGLEGTAITAVDRRWLSDREWEGMQERGVFRVRYNTRNTNPAAEIPNDALRAKFQELEGTDEAPTHKFISELEFLDLSGKDIGNFTGLEAAINLTSLTITDANMTNRRLSKLTEILKDLPDLRVLRLNGNKISNIASLASLTQLTSLTLGQNNITDVSSLSALSNLTDLNLSDNRIANIEGLGALAKLKSLDLHGNHKVADISPLAGLTSLTDLYLSRNRIVDVEPLAGLSNLQKLTLSHNRIADFEPISSVTDNLIEFRKGNQKAEPTAEFTDDNLRRAVLKALGKDPNSADPIKISEMATLTTLTAHGASISDLTGLQHAVNLKTLDLSGNALDDDDMDRLTRLTQLETLILTGNDNITSARPFRKLRNLTRLDLPENLSDPIVEISDSGLRTAILRALDKSESPETDITASELHGLEVLQASGFGIRDLTGLEHAENLRQLYLNDNQISDLSPISGLQRLRRLSLNNNSISDVGSLSNLTDLRWLRLNDNRISSVAPLDRLSNLKTLVLGNNRFSDASPLQALARLENLHLEGNPIDVDTVPERLKGLIDIPGVQATVFQQLDVNRDGTVNTDDIDIVSRFVGIPSGDLIAIENASNVYPDVDGDGDVDQDDVNAVMAASTGDPRDGGPETSPGDGPEGSGLN